MTISREKCLEMSVQFGDVETDSKGGAEYSFDEYGIQALINRAYAEGQEKNPWRDAIEEQLIIYHMLNDSHKDPMKAVKDLLDIVQAIALDPRVCSDAANLYKQGARDMRERAANAIEGQRYMLDALVAVKNLEIE